MNAVLEPAEQPEQVNLAVILTMADQLPADFYTNPKYEQELDNAIEQTNNLVYPLDDSGEKLAKADATSINKYAGLFKNFVTATFKTETDEVGKWRDKLNGKVKLLLENRQRLIDQHAEKRAEKLDEIKSMLEGNLKALFESMEIKPDFQAGDITPLVKLSSLTAGGSLTKAALTVVKTIAEGCLAQQNKIESRHLLLENRCLRADINPPLTHVHLGAVFYAEEPEFLAKVDELIEAEINRKAEMEERLLKKVEAENKQKLDDALKAQQESIANASAVATEVTPESLRKTADSIAQSAQYADRSEDKNRGIVRACDLRKQADEMEQRQSVGTEQKTDTKHDDGKKVVTVTAQFQIKVRSHISAQAVADHLKTKLPAELLEVITACVGQENG
ncbi:MAG: hypothetical protein ACXV9R_10360 [Methylobacter sp.]